MDLVNPDTAQIINLLENWVFSMAGDSASAWYSQQKEKLSGDEDCGPRSLFMAIGQVSRRMGKADLNLVREDLEAADRVRPGWRPSGWTVDQAARISLLLSSTKPAAFASRLEQLCRSADISELLSYYRGLPLFPGQEQYVFRATEGLRSNIKSVFEAVAHNNPYPCERFDENSWNHMVLKAIFIGSPLAPIIGFEKRNNLNLAGMLCHYAHERWAAGRVISPELWRGVGPFAHKVETGLTDLGKVLQSGSTLERRAAWLALKSCPSPEAQSMLSGTPKWNEPGDSTEHDWNSICREWMDSQ